MKTIGEKRKCGHGVTYHRLKMEPKRGFEYYSSKEKRASCRECNCKQYDPVKRKWEFWK